MALILNIDTSTDYASIALSMDGKLVQLMKNPAERDHASWIHRAIQELLIKCGYGLEDLQAIAVTAGPGSYTGLRIGMSTAKGLCYVLNVPLIAVNTLKVMAVANRQLAMGPRQVGGQTQKGNKQLPTGNQQVPDGPGHIGQLATQGDENSLKPLLVPMIDARRMEVYTAIYDIELNEVMPPEALILTSDSFAQWKQGHNLTFFGSGSKKFEVIASDEHFVFEKSHFDASALTTLSYRDYLDKQFADLAYAEPFYLKEFFSTGKK